MHEALTAGARGRAPVLLQRGLRDLQVPGLRRVHLRLSRLRPWHREDWHDGGLVSLQGFAGPGPWHTPERHDLREVPPFGGWYLGGGSGLDHAGLGADEVLVRLPSLPEPRAWAPSGVQFPVAGLEGARMPVEDSRAELEHFASVSASAQPLVGSSAVGSSVTLSSSSMENAF